MPADEAVQHRSDGVLGGFADLMAGLALQEHFLAGGGILRSGAASGKGQGGAGRECKREDQSGHVFTFEWLPPESAEA